jgi:outer membrane receptor protein involved in Fe transport
VFGTALGAGLDQRLKQRRFTQEVRLAADGPRIVEWTLGGFYTRERNRLAQNLYGVSALTGEDVSSLNGLVLVSLPSRYKEYAGFANATWHISPKFDLTAGGRYSHNKQSSVQNTDGALVGGASAFSGGSSDSVFTYSIAPMFKPDGNTRIFARIAKGYRPGGPNAVSPLASTAVPRQFAPDTTLNYEIGFKTQTDDLLLSFEATAFRIDWKDIQLLVQVEGLGVNTNGGRARSSGVELTAGLNPTENLSLYANGSYVDAHLTEDAPPSVGGRDGDPLPYNPKWQWTLGAEYEQPLSAEVRARAGISWHFTGKRYSDFNSTTGQRSLGAYGLIDAHAGVDFGRFRADAFVNNLTNARGITNIGFFGALNGDLAAAITRPRRIGLSLGVRY